MYILDIVRQIHVDASNPDRCIHKNIAKIHFRKLDAAIAFGMRIAKGMAIPGNAEDQYFLKRGFEETLPNGRAYEVGFYGYSMSITPCSL